VLISFKESQSHMWYCMVLCNVVACFGTYVHFWLLCLVMWYYCCISGFIWFVLLYVLCVVVQWWI